MCGTPDISKTPTPTPTPVETIATPTMADAAAQKAGASAKKNAGATAKQNIKTSPIGLSTLAQTDKKTLLGG